MSNEIQGLPVAGYKPTQTVAAVNTVSSFKADEERILRAIDALGDDPELNVDKRWLAIGRTAIEQGFMAVNRSVFKPGRVTIPGDEGYAETDLTGGR